jgi:hypothetical protein
VIVVLLIISVVGIVDGRLVPNKDDETDFRLQKAQGFESIDTFDQKCRSSLFN